MRDHFHSVCVDKYYKHRLSAFSEHVIYILKRQNTLLHVFDFPQYVQVNDGRVS